jgi:uncharacterized repeat protein (TIGR03803 family)
MENNLRRHSALRGDGDSDSGTNFTTLVNFDGANGANPVFSPLAQGVDGKLYGTTMVGGDLNCVNVGGGCGTVFKLDSAGEITTLYSFDPPSDWADGLYPVGGLVLAADGSFYGVTGYLGAYGTVFKVTPGGKLTTLYSFCSQPNCADGDMPFAGLVQASDGNFYGTTSQEGANAQNAWCPTISYGRGCGTIFKVTPGGKLTTLYSFCALNNCADGSGVYTGLVQGSDGNFYGTTGAGGTSQNAWCSISSGGSGCGTIFRITPTGKLTTLYNFCSQPNCADGSGPLGGSLIQGPDGNLYGATWSTVFKITPAGKLTTIYSLSFSDGFGPIALALASDGNFYGLTSQGGANYDGSVFRVTPSGTFTKVHDFNGTDGRNGFGGLFQPTNGTVYGTTNAGGLNDQGTVFSLSMGLQPFVSFIRNSGIVGATAQILGQGFTGTSSVSFSGIPAVFTVESDTYLTATVPAGATTAPVIVTTPSGKLKSSKVFRVTPQILSFSPTSGPVGTSVVITGVSFTGANGVLIGCEQNETQMSFTVDSDTQITAIVPAGAVSGEIKVRTPGGYVISGEGFTVTP